jgi:hypothetical protein
MGNADQRSATAARRVQSKAEVGDFAVFHDAAGRASIANRPDTVRWTERHTAGYPFFSGSLRLSRTIEVPEGAFRVRLPDEELMFAGVAQLAIDGRDLGVRAWAPYVWDVPAGASQGTNATLTVMGQVETVSRTGSAAFSGTTSPSVYR